MVYQLDNYEKAIRNFGIQVEIICAQEISGKICSKEAYNKIKFQFKELKRIRKQCKQENMHKVQD
jgi:hypothetical protein